MREIFFLFVANSRFFVVHSIDTAIVSQSNPNLAYLRKPKLVRTDSQNTDGAHGRGTLASLELAARGLGVRRLQLFRLLGNRFESKRLPEPLAASCLISPYPYQISFGRPFLEVEQNHMYHGAPTKQPRSGLFPSATGIKFFFFFFFIIPCFTFVLAGKM